MRQLFQSLGTEAINDVSMPSPGFSPEGLLIQSEYTFTSVRIERMLLGLDRGSLLRKLRLQPEKVRQMPAKTETDHLMPTLDARLGELADLTPLGFSQAGRAISVREGVWGYRVGDSVLSSSPRAEQVAVRSKLIQWLDGPANPSRRLPVEAKLEVSVWSIRTAKQGI